MGKMALVSAEALRYMIRAASANNPAGRSGSITLGFMSSDPLRDTVPTLKGRGVVFLSGVIDDGQLFLAHFQDADRNRLYLAEMKQAHRRETREPATPAKAY